MSSPSSTSWFNNLLNGTICNHSNLELQRDLDAEKSARFRTLFLSFLHTRGEAHVSDFPVQCMKGTDVDYEKIFGKSPKCQESVCISKEVFDKFEQDFLSRYHHEHRPDGSRMYFAKRRQDTIQSLQNEQNLQEKKN